MKTLPAPTTMRRALYALAMLSAFALGACKTTGESSPPPAAKDSAAPADPQPAPTTPTDASGTTPTPEQQKTNTP